MYNKIKYSLFLIIMGFSISNAAPNYPQYTDPAQPININQSSPTFIIRVASNPTTGFSWFLKKYDNKYLRVVSHKFYPPKKMMPGAGGYQEWIFTMLPAAFAAHVTTKVRLVYARPWEKGYARDYTFMVKAQ